MSAHDADDTSEAWAHRLATASITESTWAALSNRYDLRLKVFATHLLGSSLRRRYDPEDIVNEAWLHILGDLERGRFEEQGRLYGWMCFRVRRVVADLARKESRRLGDRKNEEFCESQIAGEPQDPPVAKMERDELRLAMAESLDSLPESYRRVLVSRILENRSFAEISQETGVRENTLSQQLLRGLELWRRALGQDPLAWI